MSIIKKCITEIVGGGGKSMGELRGPETRSVFLDPVPTFRHLLPFAASQ